MQRKTIVSGTRATGGLHLGNYLGAVRPWVAMTREEEADFFFFVADLHAITTAYDPATLAAYTREIVATYIACGIDPERVTLFVQSALPEHAMLQWLLSATAQMGWLNRMTQFKEKAGKHRENASLSLYAYPVLQAADVLLYQATHVPVGEDQKQHIELARDIAGSFNHHHGREVFTLPEPVIRAEGARIMSLRDGTKKMSKSDESDMTRIDLTDSADAIAQKIRKARTDSHPVPDSPESMEERPEAKNLIAIYAALSDQTREDVIKHYGGGPFSAFKTALADLCVEKLAPISQRVNALLADPAEIDRILTRGADSARARAAPTLAQAMEAMGFWTEAAARGSERYRANRA